MWMMHRYYTPLGWGFDIFNIFFTLCFIFAVAWLISRLFTHNNTKEDDEISEEDTALTILKKRYAKGEITKKQFMEMKKDIG